jgi:hypothetical protein
MSEQKQSNPASTETQQQRWLKYGSNVALGCVVAVALAIMVTYAAERRPVRIDTTAEGLYSLKPQTLKILAQVKTPIRLVSLYTKSKPPQAEDQDASPAIVPPEQATQTVNDLLEEYASKGKGITFETIDPVTSPTKADDLIAEVESKYGGEVKKYSAFVDSFKKTIDDISKIADPESKRIKDLVPQLGQTVDQDLAVTLREVLITVDAFPKSLSDLQDALQKPLKQKPPDYKGATDAITDGLGNLSQTLNAIVSNFDTLQKRGNLPDPVVQYMKASQPAFQQMKKVVDDSLAQAKQLGELKLDTLRQALRERNTILVMTDKEWKAISYDQVWQPAAHSFGMSDTAPKPRFAGEQQVTSAILALSAGADKPKVAFVRAGGEPLTQSMSFMGGQPPLADAAGRLSMYNFDVVEKDLTGQFAAQSQGQVTEPSDDEIKNATWVVWNFASQQSQFGGPPPTITAQVAQHLKDGGSAVIITGAKMDAMTAALSDWGVTIEPDKIIVHDQIPQSGEQSADMVQRALRMPYVFDIREYGDHPLAAPVNGLEGLCGFLCPVKVANTAGYKATPLLPIPTSPNSPASWATATYDPNQQDKPLTRDPATDENGPLFGGAAVEKYGGGRLVVLSAGEFPVNDMLELSAQLVDPNAPPVIRFPGNGELFTNSVFWAAHQDLLIDISPAAMDVGRIHDMSQATLNFWRVGVLLVGLPILVLLSGAGVYMKRRD